MTQKQLTLDEFLDVNFYCGGPYQTIVVLIDGKEHVVKDWWPESDAVVELGNPDLRETCNHRIVLEI